MYRAYVASDLKTGKPMTGVFYKYMNSRNATMDDAVNMLNLSVYLDIQPFVECFTIFVRQNISKIRKTEEKRIKREMDTLIKNATERLSAIRIKVSKDLIDHNVKKFIIK